MPVDDRGPLAWPRPVPTVGDPTSARARAADPAAWAFPAAERNALYRVMDARRDIRRFRPDPVPDDVLERILTAAHEAPSVGHSQPWRFVVVRSDQARVRAAVLADQARLAQAAVMEGEAGRHLLDLDLEGIREAPLGVVVACDRRTPAAGVLGRATFPDADMWSCACAIQNLWLAARAEGLGVGWVTFFRPEDLAALVGAPDGVETLGWLCIGWPDERPPAPGLERRGWSSRQPLAEVVMADRWPDVGPAAPVSRAAATPRRGRPAVPGRLRAPAQGDVVAARDRGDRILSPAGSLGVLDRVVDKILAGRPQAAATDRATLLFACADHPVTVHGISAFPPGTTRSVAEAAVAGVSAGAVAAGQAGVDLVVVDAGVAGGPVPGAVGRRPARRQGDIRTERALDPGDAERLLSAGADLAGAQVAPGAPFVALGEVGIGNTTVAAALAAALLGGDPARLVGLGAGSDSAILAAKRLVVAEAVARYRSSPPPSPLAALSEVGGAELALLAGAVLGAARRGGIVVLDGLVTCAAALAALGIEPAVAAYLVAGQRSREAGHAEVLAALGLEPLVDLRLRCGEGIGAVLAVTQIRTALAVRCGTARTVD